MILNWGVFSLSQGTFGIIQKYFWLPQLGEGGVGVEAQEAAKLLTVHKRDFHINELSGLKVQSAAVGKP